MTTVEYPDAAQNGDSISTVNYPDAVQNGDSISAQEYPSNEVKEIDPNDVYQSMYVSRVANDFGTPPQDDECL